MIPATDTTALNAGRDAQFTTTPWSAVLAARQTGSPAATAALERLCQTYWYPLYSFVRRQGSSPEDAQDLTHAFFARVLEKDYFAHVDQRKGRFGDLLKAALRHFLADCRDREHAAKRAGGKTIIHLDAFTAEERYRLEPADTGTPDSRFEHMKNLMTPSRLQNGPHGHQGGVVPVCEGWGFRVLRCNNVRQMAGGD